MGRAYIRGRGRRERKGVKWKDRGMYREVEGTNFDHLTQIF